MARLIDGMTALAGAPTQNIRRLGCTYFKTIAIDDAPGAGHFHATERILPDRPMQRVTRVSHTPTHRSDHLARVRRLPAL